MKNQSVSLLGMFILTACGQAPSSIPKDTSVSTPSLSSSSSSVTDSTQNTTASNTQNNNSAPSFTDFSIKTSAASIMINTGAGIITQDEANGMGSFGDTAGQPKRMVYSFPLASLSNVTLQTAKIRFYYDSISGSNFFANMGALKAYKIGSTGTFNASTYSAVEGTSFTVMSSLPAGIAQGDYVEFDVTAMVQQSLNAGDSYLTLKLRTDNESGGGGNGLNLYCDYASNTLAGYVPVIMGQY